ncbi:OmpA family protein [Vibrio maritimus]|uniref:OmpA family protein n=1 Tax=Vibrio maritimus TaxID=990268 RepID=UPI001F279F96|nr:OmpA family protein [Vibrio maritimus]
MRKTVVAASIIGAMTAAAPVLADEGFYLGGRLGGSQLSDACNISGAECTDSGFSAGFFAGYDWNDYIALEFAYDWLGSYKTSFIEGSTGYRQDANMSALTLAPKFAYPFTDDWSVFAKVGAAYTTYGDRNATALMGGVGLEYDFATAWSGRLEYQRINDFKDGWLNTDVDTFWLGVSYSFGNAAAAAAAATAAAVTQAPAEEPPVVEAVVMTKTFEQVSGQETFAFNSTELDEEKKADFDPLIALMKEHPEATVTIVGYTDSSGPEEVNQRISEERAESIASYLESQGIDRSRMSVSGMGEANPVADNSTSEGRAQNRRVEITVPEFEYTVEEMMEKTQ